MSAAQGGHVAVARLLLQHGADVAGRNDGFTALMCAAEVGHEAVARCCCSTVSMLVPQPLVYAAGGGHVAVARLLLQHGADVSGCKSNDWLHSIDVCCSRWP